jgi:hypothetical protein
MPYQIAILDEQVVCANEQPLHLSCRSLCFLDRETVPIFIVYVNLALYQYDLTNRYILSVIWILFVL